MSKVKIMTIEVENEGVFEAIYVPEGEETCTKCAFATGELADYCKNVPCMDYNHICGTCYFIISVKAVKNDK